MTSKKFLVNLVVVTRNFLDSTSLSALFETSIYNIEQPFDEFVNTYCFMSFFGNNENILVGCSCFVFKLFSDTNQNE